VILPVLRKRLLPNGWRLPLKWRLPLQLRLPAPGNRPLLRRLLLPELTCYRIVGLVAIPFRLDGPLLFG
jgi:hypothetical protein